MKTAFMISAVALLASCSSVSYTGSGGETVHVQNSFGANEIASVSTPGGFRVEGFRSDHSKVTNDVTKGWFSFRFWRAFWLGPIGQGAGDVLSSGGQAITNSTAP